MLDKKPKKKSETVKVSQETYQALNDLKNRIIQSGGKKRFIGDLLDEAWRQYQASGLPQPHLPPPAEFPSPFKDLNDDQIWIITNLIEILKLRPQDPIFLNLYSTIEIAVTEYRKRYAQKSSSPRRRPHK
jgi:hypothetical protein